jgi:microcystin-dependent protein
MSDQFVAEIRIFPFNFPPTGWAFCDGQVMPISQNTALFSLLGTTYGGNGQSTFALPNLQGSLPMQQSSFGAPGGLTPRELGEQIGTETVTLLSSEIPVHTHIAQASIADGTEQAPGQQLLAAGVGVGAYADAANLTQLHPQATAPAGGGLPHNNMMPYLTLSFCIALQGIFPPRP